MENFDFSELEKRINEAKAASAETKEQKIAKLIVILSKIESELVTLQNTLNKLLEHHAKHNGSSKLLPQIVEKIQTTERLKLKIQKARLNLSYTFL